MSTAIIPMVATLLAPANEPPEQPLQHVVWLAVPAGDAVRGGAVGYEHWLLPVHRLSASVSAELRQTATGDYGGMHAGGGVELRWYWRAHSRWSRQPAGSMVGWFAGARVDVGGDWTHAVGQDGEPDRHLGTALVVGGAARVGYRIQPWRGLEITPTIGHAFRVEHDVSGRLAPWTRHGHTIGLTVGWMF